MPLPIAPSPAPAPVTGPPHRRAPTKLFVEVTSRCNLRCEMCPRQAPGGRDHDGDITAAAFERLAPAFPGVEALVLNGIGESLLHRGLEGFVARARADLPADAWIGFQTNGQLVTPERARSLVRAGVDRVCVSADTVDPEKFRRLRAGGQQGAVEAALEALHGAARAERRGLSLGVEFVAMRDNLGQLPDVVRWAAHHHVAFVIVTHMVPYSAATTSAAAYDVSSDAAQDWYETWRARAAAEGVDLTRYLDVFMRFRLGPEERRVVEWTSRMVNEGAARGVSLNIARLLRADRALRARVEATFAEAAEVARAEGVDLRLPAAVPKHARRCDFVEDGSAFVSWSGEVHPCYFLWHRTQCHAGGWEKRVAPLSFGSLRERDILEIWNAPEFAAFRGEVGRYEFARCYDCNSALCSDVRDENVEDCHLGEVPCAACPWATGLLQCLR